MGPADGSLRPVPGEDIASAFRAAYQLAAPILRSRGLAWPFQAPHERKAGPLLSEGAKPSALREPVTVPVEEGDDPCGVELPERDRRPAPRPKAEDLLAFRRTGPVFVRVALPCLPNGKAASLMVFVTASRTLAANELDVSASVLASVAHGSGLWRASHRQAPIQSLKRSLYQQNLGLLIFHLIPFDAPSRERGASYDVGRWLAWTAGVEPAFEHVTVCNGLPVRLATPTLMCRSSAYRGERQRLEPPSLSGSRGRGDVAMSCCRLSGGRFPGSPLWAVTTEAMPL